MNDLPDEKKDPLKFTPSNFGKEGSPSGGVESEPTLAPREKTAEASSEVAEFEHVSEIPQAEEIQLPSPVITKHDGIIVDNISPSKVRIELPMASDKISEKAKRGMSVITDSAFWLVTFCRRALGLTKSKFTYSPKEV